LNSLRLDIRKFTYFQRNTQISKKNIEAVNAEDAAVADATALAGGEQLYIAPTSVKILAQGDTIFQFED